MEDDVLPGDLEAILRAIGLLGIYAIIFAESGLLVGIFLPGDSVLFTAGVLAAEGFFSYPALMIGAFIAAVTGDAIGYWFGRRVGRRLYERPDSRWFKQAHLDKAEMFYDRHGGKAIVLARFIPIVRTLAPIVAGMSEMQYGRFTAFNVIGGVLWAIGLTTAGYVLGRSIPNIDHYLLPIIAVIVLVSLLPTLIHVWRDHRREIMAAVRERLEKRRSTAPSPESEGG
jgi:membrane-associated protein